jgi:hypothetical protein
MVTRNYRDFSRVPNLRIEGVPSSTTQVRLEFRNPLEDRTYELSRHYYD